MKKIILSAFCLGLAFTSVNALAHNSTATVKVVIADDRTVIKAEELPEPVKTTLASDAYKGWAVKEAAIINKAEMPYYEVTLNKDKETKTVKFQKDGTLLN